MGASLADKAAQHFGVTALFYLRSELTSFASVVVTNTKPTPATLKKVEVLDARSQGVQSTAVVASYEGDALVSRLRTLANTPANSPEIEFNGTRLFLIDLTFDSQAQVPGRLKHLFELTGASGPAPHGNDAGRVELYRCSAGLAFRSCRRSAPRWPARGGWRSTDAAKPAEYTARSGLAANGSIYYGQRFAIDWMRLDDAGRLVHGDPADVHNYACYGVDVLAVANGTVVQVLDALGRPATRRAAGSQDNDRRECAWQSRDSRSWSRRVRVLCPHGKGLHSRGRGSAREAGRCVGKLGNSGNTSAPHLHFHLMEGQSALASNGIPYLIDSFALAGKIPAEKDPAAADSIEGSWSGGLFPGPSPRHGQFPLNLDVINFPEVPGKQ